MKCWLFEKIDKIDKLPNRLREKNKTRRHKLSLSVMKEGISL